MTVLPIWLGSFDTIETDDVCMYVCVTSRYVWKRVLETTVMLHMEPARDDDHLGVMCAVLLFVYRKISAIINVN